MVATTSEEIHRRLKRMSEPMPQERFEAILKTYMDDLAGMGFGSEWRYRVLKSSMTGYQRILYKAQEGRPGGTGWESAQC